jgi:NADH-quinone oxidoreductase subunit I
MVAPPHAMADGMRERDYYLGKVTTATPEQRAWADAREADLAQSEPPASTSKTTTSTGVSDR